MSTVIGILLGLAPALNLLRVQTADFLGASGRTMGTSGGTRRVRSALVAAEFAIAMVLLTGAGLLIRSFMAVHNVDPGFQPQHVLKCSHGPAERDVTGSNNTVLCASYGPDRGAAHSAGRARSKQSVFPEQKANSRVTPGGRAPARAARRMEAAGLDTDQRGLFSGDGNSSSARALLRRTRPRGRNDGWLSVVGIVRDTHSGGLERAPLAQIYEPQSQSGEQIGNLVVRTAGDPIGLAASVRSIVHAANPHVIVPSISTVEQVLDEQEMCRGDSRPGWSRSFQVSRLAWRRSAYLR